jgi:two-component system cell cycle sensor histidine kinase/response regulator CckA
MTQRPPNRWKHDLKNQLGVILGFSELLLQELDPADARRADIAEIHTAAQRSMEILTQVPASADEDPGA